MINSDKLISIELTKNKTLELKFDFIINKLRLVVKS